MGAWAGLDGVAVRGGSASPEGSTVGVAVGLAVGVVAGVASGALTGGKVGLGSPPDPVVRGEDTGRVAAGGDVCSD